MTLKWHFRRFRPGDPASDPNFARTLFSEDVARSLVRESIQNSLDAALCGEAPVRVRFTIRTGAGGAAPSAAAAFLDGMWTHVNAESAGLDDPPRPSDRIPYLVVEDFGTSGLVGDPAAWDPFESERNSFYLFFRALGRSGKKDEERGRWGVGKFVFPLASRAHTLFGYTIPVTSQAPLLMGRAVVKLHQVNGVGFHPDGHWGRRQSEDDLVLAEDHPEILREFRDVFSISRRDEPGLSVVVPWLKVRLDRTSIAEASVAEYFLPILRSELIVEIDDNGQIETIDESTIVAVADTTRSAELRARIALAVEAATWPYSELLEIPTVELSGDPDWSELISVEKKAELLERLEEHQPIGVRVPLVLRPKERPPVRTWFDVFLQRVDGLGTRRPLIVREGITISEEKTQSVQDHVALVVVDHRPFASFVGDAETPAHTTLQYDLVAQSYTLAGKGLRLLRTAASEILKALEESSTSDDFSILADFFPVVDETEPERRRTSRRRPGSDPPPPAPPIPRATPRYRISQTEHGFRVQGTGEGEVPATLTIRFAYEVRRGNPFKQYNPLDFSLLRHGDLSVEFDAAEVIDRSHNALIVSPTASGFSVDVNGFDSLRDLVVRVDARSTESES